MPRRPAISVVRLSFIAVVIAGFSFLTGLLVQLWPELQRVRVLGTLSDVTAADIVFLMNQERSRHNLGELTISPQLSEAAARKSRDMLERQYWSHTAPDGTPGWEFIKQTGYEYEVAGENLARDFQNAPEIITAWLDSPSHRENLLSSEFTQVGIATARGDFRGQPTIVVTALFARPTGKTELVSQILVFARSWENR